jgi:hypothetical protein
MPAARLVKHFNEFLRKYALKQSINFVKKFIQVLCQKASSRKKP